jgi:hypothetical protein
MSGLPSIFNGKIPLTPYFYGLLWSIGFIILVLFCLRNILYLVLDLIGGNTEQLKGRVTGLKYLRSGKALWPTIHFQIGGKKFKYIDTGGSKNYSFLTKNRNNWKIRFYAKSGIPITLSSAK